MHSHLPLLDGSKLTYRLYRFSGVMNPITLKFDRIYRTPYDGPNAVQTMVQTHMPMKFPFIAQTTCGDKQPHRFDKERALFKSIGRDGDGRTYIGESMNQLGMVELPPIPLLHVDPEPGRVISGSSMITTAEGGQEPFPWQSACVHAGERWEKWPDTIRMALLENPDHPGRQGYNSIYARGVGEVHFWKGNIKPDWTCDDGWEWIAIDPPSLWSRLLIFLGLRDPVAAGS